MPLSAIPNGDPGALLAIEMLPLALPVAVGANLAVNVALCPALIVNGVVIPLMLNPVPETLAADTITLAVPVLFNVTVAEPLLPTATLPKLTLAGLAPSVPCMPVPLSAIPNGDPGALLAIEMLPLALPVAVGANLAVNVALCPALIVNGVVIPLMLNPVPETLAADTITLAVPVLFNVTVAEPLLPTATLPKLTLAGLAPSVPCMPVPLSVIPNGDPGALLAIEMLPLALPVAVGANLAVNVALCPALIVNGVVIPLMLNPAPETLAADMVTLAVPVLFNVTVAEPLLPTATLPKLTLAGLAPSVPCMPVPLSVIPNGDPGALLAIEMLPLALPVAVGANLAVNVALCPALIVNGVVIPLMLNPVPETLAADMVTLAVPVLFNVTVAEPLLPTATLPKLTLAGLAPSVPCTPVPLSEIASGEFEASLVTVSVPLAAPVDCGTN